MRFRMAGEDKIFSRHFLCQKMANEAARLHFTVPPGTTSLKRHSLFFTFSPNSCEALLVKLLPMVACEDVPLMLHLLVTALSAEQMKTDEVFSLPPSPRLWRTRCFIKFPQIFTFNLFITNKLYYCSVSLFAFAQQNTVLR